VSIRATDQALLQWGRALMGTETTHALATVGADVVLQWGCALISTETGDGDISADPMFSFNGAER
jgi:hypothetical protein